jgi:prenyltransferase beta subunit
MQKHLIYYFLCVAAIFACSKRLSAQQTWKESLLQYITRNLAKTDGGYGWDDQPDSHLEPTFAVVGILNDINKLPTDRSPLIDYIKNHHPQRQANKETGPSGFDGRTLLYEQIQGTRWLGGDPGAFKMEVENMKSDTKNLYNYEKHNYGVFAQEALVVICADLLHLSNNGYPGLPAYLSSRRRANGSFNNAPDSAGGDGNIINTYWGMYAYHLLGRDQQLKTETIKWYNNCQLKNGGFTHQPKAKIGNNDDIAYTWAAVKGLQLLSAKPSDSKSCINYLLSLRNADGGFGNRPGLPSTPMSTFYAIDALKALDAYAYLDNSKPVEKKKEKLPDLSGYKVYTVQFQAFGGGSPAEAVMLADSMKIQLWGAKNAPKGWIESAQYVADEKKVKVTFFHADEPYGKDVRVEGMGNFGHILDNYYPASASLDIPDSAYWSQLSKGFLETLKSKRGGLVLQISNNEPLVRILLDESIKKKNGYAAISTIHFGQNFLFFLPFLYQYRHQLPFIALQDAHGMESWWWSNDLLAYRTLFLAKEPTYEGMLDALKNNLLVAVRHDSLSFFKTRMLGGAPGVQQYILSQTKKWKWWNDDNTELVRPWAAVTVINHADSFEVASPDTGVVIRIRPWWDTNKQIMKSALVTLEQLLLDDQPVDAVYVESKDKKGAITDSYYLYKITNPSKGHHTIKLTLRNAKNSQIKTMTENVTF